MTSEAPIKALVLAEMLELRLDSPEAQNQLAKAEGAIKTEKEWWELQDGKLLVPEELAPTLVSQTHQVTYIGHDKLEELIQKYFLVPCLSSLCRTESQNCTACSQVSADSRHRQIQLKGRLPSEHLEVDFTNETSQTRPLPAGHGMYILRMGSSFSYLD